MGIILALLTIIQTILSRKPSFYLDPKATYVVAGGFGGIGRSIARWMVDRNARNLILLSRSGGTSSSAKELLEEFRTRGVAVEAPACDITDLGMMQQKLEPLLKRSPPVKGLLQASMVPRVRHLNPSPYQSRY